MRRLLIFSTLVFATISLVPAWAQSPSPSSSPSSSPSPSNSPSVRYRLMCAPIPTGLPKQTKLNECPKGQLSLGRGPIVHGLTRPNAINPILRNRFISARTAARNLGFKISIRSGWRSWKLQQSMYERALRQYGDAKTASRWVLPPERSMHVWGVAIDVQFNSPEAKNWFRWNSYRFGLCRPYKNEWWHYEPTISPGGTCPAMLPYAK